MLQFVSHGAHFAIMAHKQTQIETDKGEKIPATLSRKTSKIVLPIYMISKESMSAYI